MQPSETFCQFAGLVKLFSLESQEQIKYFKDIPHDISSYQLFLENHKKGMKRAIELMLDYGRTALTELPSEVVDNELKIYFAYFTLLNESNVHSYWCSQSLKKSSIWEVARMLSKKLIHAAPIELSHALLNEDFLENWTLLEEG
jgi:hypothetical protein